MYACYDHEEDGILLLSIEISSSFAPDGYFKVYQDKGNVVAYWRTELDRETFFNIFTGLEIDRSVASSLDEIFKTTAFRQRFNMICPLASQVLTIEQENILFDLINAELDEKIHLPGGRDGHSYRIVINKGKPTKIQCWCEVTPEWRALADAVNMLVIDVAGLDAYHYAIQIRE